MTITKEQARADVEKVMQEFKTVGYGTESDRVAQLVMQTLGVLERRLGKRTAIKMLYIDNPDASRTLPPIVYETARQYIDGSINEAQARDILQDASRQYGAVFQEMGINFQESAVIFKKF